MLLIFILFPNLYYLKINTSHLNYNLKIKIYASYLSSIILKCFAF
jgi:hypothetical protein